VVASIIAVAFLALTLVLSRFLDPEALAARVEPRLEGALARDVEIGRVEVGLFPLGVRLRDVTVADPTGLAPFLARMGSMEFRVDLLPLIRKQVRIGRLVLESPYADLRIDGDGRSNFGDLSTRPPDEPQPGEGTEADAFSLDLRGIRVSGGTFQFQSRRDTTSLTVDDLQVRASVQHDAGGPWVFTGESEAGVRMTRGSAEPTLGQLPLSLSFDLETDADFEELRIRSGNLGSPPLALAVSGTVAGLKDPVRNLTLRLEGEGIPVDRLVEVLSDRFQIQVPGKALGIMAAALAVEGDVGPGKTPRVSGTVTVAGAGLEASDGTLVAQDISVGLELTGADQVQFETAGEVLDGPFSLRGEATFGASKTVSAELRANPDLGLVPYLAELPDGVSVMGRLDTRARLNGSLDDLRSFRMWGEAAPSEIRLTHPAVAVPVFLPRGQVSLSGDGVTFVDLPVSLGEEHLFLTGEVRGLSALGLPGRTVAVRSTVRGPRLNLVELSNRPLPDPDLTYGKVAFARMGNRTLSGRSPEEAARELRLARPDSIPAAGELQVALDTLIYAKGRVADLRARVEFGPSFVRITESSMKQYGGDVWTSMDLALGETEQEPFNFSLRVRDLDAGEFLSTASPLGTSVRGRLSLDLDLAGNLDRLLLPDKSTLVGSGRFSLAQGGLNSIPLTQSLSAFLDMPVFRAPEIPTWAASLVLENGWVRMGDSRLEGAPGDPVVGGGIGFGGELDLLSIFEINADNLGAFALENLGIHDALAGRIEGRPGMVQAVVRMGGTVLAPELRGDPGAMAQTLTQAVKEEAQAEAERQIEEQRTRLQNRATGFLTNLFRPRDTTGAVPGGAIPRDTLRPDTVPPDTVRPDTVQPDTVRPDTVRPDSVRPDTVPPDTGRVQAHRPGKGS